MGRKRRRRLAKKRQKYKKQHLQKANIDVVTLPPASSVPEGETIRVTAERETVITVDAHETIDTMNLNDVINVASEAIVDRSEQMAQALAPSSEPSTSQAIAPDSPIWSSARRRRGRMVWSVYSKGRKSSNDGLKFQSPALVPPGTHVEQEQNAKVRATEKGARLLRLEPADVMVNQAGGFGHYYDESDAAQNLP
jgi:hypothetical protein